MTHRSFTLVALLFLLAACPADDAASGPVDTCEKAAQQCRMAGGQLGVCSMDSEGELFCMSQH